MPHKIIAPLVVALAAFAALPSQAIVAHVDDLSMSAVRPLSGWVNVDFTGTIELTPGFEYVSTSISSLWTAGQDMLNDGTPYRYFPAPGILFSMRVWADDAAGLYAYTFDGGTPFVTFSECPISGGSCNNATFAYSLEVLEPNAVPEPASGILLAAGLAGLGLVARRRAHARAQLTM